MTTRRKPLEHTTIDISGSYYSVYYRYYPEQPQSLYDPGEPEEYEIELILNTNGKEIVKYDHTREEIEQYLKEQRTKDKMDNFIEPDDDEDSYV